MSTITVTNIKATGETTSRAVSGVAAAWVNFNGTGTVAIRDSQGVSGLVDNGTGNYTISYSNSFSSVNYVVVGTNTEDSGVTSSIYGIDDAHTYSTSATQIVNYDQSGYTFGDTVRSNTAAHGDLA